MADTKRDGWAFWAALLLVAGMTLASGSAKAVVPTPPPYDITYSFYGDCTDCVLLTPAPPPFVGAFVASLTVQDYVPGTPLGPANFVAFSYGGSNLFPAFTYSGTPPLPTLLTGILPAGPLPPPGAPQHPVPLLPGQGFALEVIGGCSLFVSNPNAYNMCMQRGLGNLDFAAGVQPMAWSPTGWNLLPRPADYGLLNPPLVGVATAVPGTAPEPASLALVGLALAGLAASRKRRRQ